MKILQSEESQITEKVAALQEFQLYVREGDALYMKQHFKCVLLFTIFIILFLILNKHLILKIFKRLICRRLLKTLIGSLASDNKEMQIEVLQSLIDMLKCPELAESFSNYAELLVLKVIRAHKFDDQKSDASSSGNNSRTTVKYPEVYWVLFLCVALFIETHLLSTITEKSRFC